MRDISELNKCLYIDEHNLDQELIKQPVIFNEISQAYAESASIRDQLKYEVEKAYADVSLAVRAEFLEEGRKVTEDLVVQTTLIDEAYVESQTAYLEAKRVCEEWSSLKEAFIQRSFMLRDLVSLYLGGYYSESSIKGGADAAKEVQYEQTKKKMATQRQNS